MSIFRRGICAGLAGLLAFQAIFADLAHASPVPSHPLIILQDIHGHIEAQKNIAATLARLQAESKMRSFKVGVEGAAGPFDFSAYLAFPDKELTKTIAWELLGENKIGASELAGLIETPVTFVGIEKPDLYRANVEAYRSSAKIQGDQKAELEHLGQAITFEKARTFTPELKKFDLTVRQYRKGQLPFPAYLKILSATAPSPSFTVETFLAAADAESKLNFKQAERERDKLLVSMSGRISGKTPDLSAFPMLADYVRYARLAESVDADKLFSESRALEKSVFSALLTRAPKEAADVVRRDRELYLAGKLVRFELTPDEWEEVRGSTLGLRSFRNFYSIADDRSAAMVREIVSKDLDAIVVGGFHTPEIVRRLKLTGRDVRVMRPKIKALDAKDGTTYLTVFAEKKTPLEKLFSRWKLFLAPPVAIGVTQPLVEMDGLDARNEFAARQQLRSTASRTATRRAVRLLFRGGPQWSRETIIFMGPLAAGILFQSPALIAVGLFVSVILHVLTHRPVRFFDRLI